MKYSHKRPKIPKLTSIQVSVLKQNGTFEEFDTDRVVNKPGDTHYDFFQM